MYSSDLDDITDFEFSEFIKNTKTWILNIAFLSKKEIIH